MGLTAKEVCFDSWEQPGIFLFEASTSALGPTHSPIWRVPGALYPKAKPLEHEADHVPESSSDVKNEGGCTCATPYTLMSFTGRTLLLLYTSNSSTSIM